MVNRCYYKVREKILRFLNGRRLLAAKMTQAAGLALIFSYYFDDNMLLRGSSQISNF